MSITIYGINIFDICLEPWIRRTRNQVNLLRMVSSFITQRFTHVNFQFNHQFNYPQQLSSKVASVSQAFKMTHLWEQLLNSRRAVI